MLFEMVSAFKSHVAINIGELKSEVDTRGIRSMGGVVKGRGVPVAPWRDASVQDHTSSAKAIQRLQCREGLLGARCG